MLDHAHPLVLALDPPLHLAISLAAADFRAVRTLLVVVLCAAAAGLFAVLARRRRTWSGTTKLALLMFSGAALGTMSYALVADAAPTAYQRVLLPALQMVKDGSGMVMIAFTMNKLAERSPVLAHPRRLGTVRLLKLSVPVFAVCGAVAASLILVNPAKTDDLNVSLSSWAFAYRTFFCGPVIVYAVAAAVVQLEACTHSGYLSSFVSRARHGFASFGFLSLSLAASSYIGWPIYHAVSGVRPYETSVYLVVESVTWVGLVVSWMVVYAIPYRRSEVERSMEHFDTWDHNSDALLYQLSGYAPIWRTRPRGWHEKVAVLRYGAKLLNGQGEHTISKEGVNAAILCLELFAAVHHATGAEAAQLRERLRLLSEPPDDFSNRIPDSSADKRLVTDSLIPQAATAVLTLTDQCPVRPAPNLSSSPRWAQLATIAAADLGMIDQASAQQILYGTPALVEGDLLRSYRTASYLFSSGCD